jgi:hypothetical protein
MGNKIDFAEKYKNYLNELISFYKENNNLKGGSMIASKHHVTGMPFNLFMSLGLDKKDEVTYEEAQVIRNIALDAKKKRRQEIRLKREACDKCPQLLEDDSPRIDVLNKTDDRDYVRFWKDGELFRVAFCYLGDNYNSMITVDLNANKIVEFKEAFGKVPKDAQMYVMKFIEYKNLLCMIRDYYLNICGKLESARVDRAELTALRDDNTLLEREVRKWKDMYENTWSYKLKKFFKR